MTRSALSGLILVLAACGGSGGKDPHTLPGTPTGTPGGTGGGSVGTPPSAQNDLGAVDEGGAVTLEVAENDLVTTNPLALGSITVVDPPVHGTVTTQANGTVDYVHDGGETTEDGFTYFIEDDEGLPSNVATVVLDVAPINDLPVANDDVDGVDQGANIQIDLAGNDLDVDDGLDLASIAVVDPPAFGSVAVNGNGTVDYVHDGTGVPYDSFTYTIADNSGAASNVATVDLSVYTSNLPPIAGDDFLIAGEGVTGLVDLAGNDVDVDDGLDLGSIAVLSAPAHGTVVLNGDGTASYVHDGSEDASDSFTYRIYDLSGAPSNVAAVVVAVVNVNDPPQANDDSAVVDERQTVRVPVLANDVDVDDALVPGSLAIVTYPAYGAVAVNGDGTVDYTHDGSQAPADSFTYQVNDAGGAASNVATVNVQVALLNDPPEVTDGSESVNEGDVALFDLVPYAFDPDDGVDVASIAITNDPLYGAVTVHPDGTVTYTHDGSEGPYDVFEFTISDLGGNVSNPATVDISVAPVNDPPIAVADAFTAPEGGAGTALPVLANDVDVDDGLDVGSVTILSAATNGVASANVDGTVSYSHNGSETVADSFSYRVSDQSGAPSATVVASITITATNDAPVAVGDATTVAEGGGVNVAVLTNDSDVDDGLDITSVTVVSPPARGSATVNANGTIDYTHNGSETASDSFTYRVDDLSGASSNTVTVSVTVTPVNDPPTAVADAATVAEGSAGNVIAVLANDSDPDDGLNVATVSIQTAPTRGSAVANPAGTVTYTHNGSDNPGDSFTYRVSDNSGATSNTVTVTLTVTPVNDPPVANNDTGVSVAEGGNVGITVLANDNDTDDGLNVASVAIVSPPARGTATPQANGTVSYTHDGGETASDSFTYRVSDLAGAQSNVATVSITVTPVNDPPVAVNDAPPGTVANGAGVIVPVAANDTDADNALNLNSIVIVSAPTSGTAVPQANGTVDYTHNGSATLSDVFTYRISDAAGAQSNVATVSLTIDAAPTSGGMLFTIRESTNTLVRIDPDTLVFTDVGPLGVGFDFGDLAYDASTGNLYMVDGRGSKGLYTVNPATGAASLVGLHNVGDMFGVVANGSGQLYGEASGSWYSLNKTTGAATLLGPTQVQACPVWDSARSQMLSVSFTGSVYSVNQVNGAATLLGPASPVYLDNSGSAYDSANDLIWSIGWGGTLTIHDPANGYAQTNLGSGYGSHDGMAFIPGGGHMSEPFNPPNSQPWFCSSGAELAYWEYFGETTFDECEQRANATGTQYYTGANLAYTSGWIGDQGGANAVAAPTGYDWSTEEIVPRTSLRSCALAVLDDRGVPTVSPPEQIYFDAATGRTWHYWDIIGQNHDQTMAFAGARGARIINPNVVGLTGLARITPPTHWCFASAEFNGANYCNTGDICNFMVGYWE